jgi:hypothetical protein
MIFSPLGAFNQHRNLQKTMGSASLTHPTIAEFFRQRWPRNAKRAAGRLRLDNIQPASDPLYPAFEAVKPAVDARDPLLRPGHTQFQIAHVVNQTVELPIHPAQISQD